MLQSKVIWNEEKPIMRTKFTLIIMITWLVQGCTGAPSGIKPVEGFEIKRYLGTWYEIARLEHRFEKNLIKVTANYTQREDGGIKVVNRGYDIKKKKWRSATGRAYFVDRKTTGQLKVSFFGPFYSSYNVIALDKQAYRYALVSGPNRKYLWILSRDKTLAPGIKNRLLAKAKALGFDTSQLIYPDH
jgi:apolipoprotein D and lipocalin family protein